MNLQSVLGEMHISGVLTRSDLVQHSLPVKKKKGIFTSQSTDTEKHWEKFCLACLAKLWEAIGPSAVPDG